MHAAVEKGRSYFDAAWVVQLQNFHFHLPGISDDSRREPTSGQECAILLLCVVYTHTEKMLEAQVYEETVGILGEK